MIENYITEEELENPLNEDLFYVNRVKETYIKAQEALQDLKEYYEHDYSFFCKLLRVEDRLIQSDNQLNELFNLSERI